jgi:hypothetical protein
MMPGPIRTHESRCPACERREWCDTVMDLIARLRHGLLSYDFVALEIRAAQVRQARRRKAA